MTKSGAAVLANGIQGWRAPRERLECLGHPAGTAYVAGVTLYCDGSCRR
jgi:hypothetical protein